MKILFLEPFFGGSHKDFATGFKAHSEHDVDLVTMPDRFWKWRMRGAALHFFDQIEHLQNYDALFVTDMMDLTDFSGLFKDRIPPVLFYFHENQLSYPLSAGEKRDFHLGFTNIISAAAADTVLFNSAYHMKAFFTSAEKLISRLPDFRPGSILETIRAKSGVAHPGCRFDPGRAKIENKQSMAPLIIWNHRWEHDKNPGDFYTALIALKKKNIPFSLAVLGENYKEAPRVFETIRREFKEQIRVFGYVSSRLQYIKWLKQGDIVISCACQENFGISVVEAVRSGCMPLLPDRLSYPEIIPEKFHETVLYHSVGELTDKLSNMVSNLPEYLLLRQRLADEMGQYAWHIRVKQYDKALNHLKIST